MNMVEFPEEPGQERMRKMAAVYADLYAMTEAEIDAVARCVDAIRIARASPPAAQVRPLRHRTR